jgi:hypothetical protein
MDNIICINKRKAYNYEEDKNKKEYHKQLHQYKKSWGMWSDNNLLNISIDIFTYKIKS